MASQKTSAKFYAGPIVLQPPGALDSFVRVAKPETEFVYCEAPEPMYGETWSRAGELARDGLVRTHHRRRAGGGWQWYLVRTRKALPREVSAEEKVLADRATAAIFTELKRAANFARPCPSDTELAQKSGLSTRHQAAWRVRKLIDLGLIESMLSYEGGIPTRVVTIVATGKFTALPKKWAALHRAAESELRAADDADLARLRSAGL